MASTPSPLPIRKRNRWITPVRKELLPKTMLGLKPASKGQIEEAWIYSKIIKKKILAPNYADWSK